MTFTSAARDTFHDRNSTMRLVCFHVELLFLNTAEVGKGGGAWWRKDRRESSKSPPPQPGWPGPVLPASALLLTRILSWCLEISQDDFPQQPRDAPSTWILPRAPRAPERTGNFLVFGGS